MQTITIIFDEDGNPEIRVAGVKGTKCQDATRAVQRALGVVVKDTMTADMNAREETKRYVAQ